MKMTLCKQMGWLSMLVFFLNQAYATQPQRQNELLLPYVLSDSLVSKTTIKTSVTATVIPLQSNIRNYVDKYLDENGAILERIKEQKSGTLMTIQQILVKRGIPAGLMYLAIVESELNNRATSRVGAAGIWQMMPETARSLGLQVNGKTDQRRHINKSSVAAADYLKALYKQFDDWLLVVAAFNCGAGNVYKAIKLSGSREFWKMQRYLPAETNSHVKHFIATHFYYEESGSLVTLTKKERISYLASLDETVMKAGNNKPVDAPAALNQPTECALIDEGCDGGLVVGLENK
jgi:membrane-bound lytic murein transglycosylase D